MPCIFVTMGLCFRRPLRGKSPESFPDTICPPSSGFLFHRSSSELTGICKEFNGKNGSLLVAMYPDPAGFYPIQEGLRSITHTRVVMQLRLFVLEAQEGRSGTPSRYLFWMADLLVLLLLTVVLPSLGVIEGRTASQHVLLGAVSPPEAGA